MNAACFFYKYSRGGSSGAFGFPWRSNSMGRGSWPRWANLLQHFLGRGINAPHPAAYVLLSCLQVFAFAASGARGAKRAAGLSVFTRSVPSCFSPTTSSRLCVCVCQCVSVLSLSLPPVFIIPRSQGRSKLSEVAPPPPREHVSGAMLISRRMVRGRGRGLCP